MVEALLIVLVVLAVVGLVLIVLLLRKGPADLSPVLARLDNLERSQDKVATAVRDELSRGRSESAEASRLLRQEVGESAKGTLDSLVRGLADLGDQQGKRLDAFAEQLSKATEASQADARLLREENAKSIQNLSASTLAQAKLSAEAQQERLTGFAEKLDLLATTVDGRLKDGQAASDKQIAEMRSDSVAPEKLKQKLEEVHEALQTAAEQKLDDFFEFLIEPARSEIQAAPGGGGVFSVVARMDGRDFARFHLDVGFGDSVIGGVETLEGDNLLDFAGITPARAVAIPKAQQFAEKIHAYSYSWTDSSSSSTRQSVLRPKRIGCGA